MFVHLKCHSRYSFLRAVPAPQELIAAAADAARAAGDALPEALRGGAVALTDTNGLYAAVPFYQAARTAGVRPILGAEIDFTFESSDVKLNGQPRDQSQANIGLTTQTPCNFAPGRPGAQGFSENGRADDADPDTPRTAFQFAEHTTRKTETWPGPKLLLLACDATGYSNLCRLVTERHITEQPVGLEKLALHRQGLLALYLPHAARNDAGGSPDVGCLQEIFGPAFYLQAQRLAPGDGRALRETLRLGQELGVAVAATNNVHFLRPAEHLHHRVLNAIRTGALVSQLAPAEITTPAAYFKSAAEMQRVFPDHPELLRATLDIAEQCNLQLELGKTIFPEFPVPAGESPFSYLWQLCFAGAQRRYQPLHPAALRRLTHELEVINQLNLAPYFLLVWDIVEEARRRGIPAVARGSAASSIVTYCLGISRVCPLRWSFYFERFLNEQRGDLPDIDIDICGARRDELLDYVYQRWGREHVAMIGSFVTMHARMAVREVAKVYGVPPREVNRFTRRLPHRPVREILEAIRTLPECRALPVQEEPWRTILQVALRLDDFPRHLGIHPCGTVIAAPASGGLTNLVPLEWARKGIVVTQYDMHAVEGVGLVKMDLLGQRGLTTMSLALRNIGRAGLQPVSAGDTEQSHRRQACATTACHIELSKISTRPPTIDFDAIPENDPAACAMIARGQTLGIFQVESPGMRGLLRTMQARTLEEVSLALALIRPGASEYGSKESFIKRIRGTEPVRYPHPCLEPILRDTLGICVYQEQVMQIAQAAGGMSLAESDLVRRASAKFADDRERERLRTKFLKAAGQLGLEGAARDASWQMVEKFAGFGFCKAHAATYADLSYRMAWLKAHYPAEFLAAMCSSGAGFYHVSAYVEEAKRLGIAVRLPSVNHSQVEYTTEGVAGVFRRGAFPDESPASEEAGYTVGPHSTAIRIGLMQVRGLRAETMARIVHAREQDGSFRSLEDFLQRVTADQDEMEALIKCGALDEVQTPRAALLWELHLTRPPQAPGEALLFPDSAPPRPASLAAQGFVAADYTREQRMRYEQELLEVCVSGHPLDLVRRNGEQWSSDLQGRPAGEKHSDRLHIGKRVTLLGWVITYRRVGTKNYRNMMFVTLEDQRGVYEAVLFPGAYERYGAAVFASRLLRVYGRIEAELTVNCDRLEEIRL
jgi:DNA-directed DNA polymerase III PolC